MFSHQPAEDASLDMLVLPEYDVDGMMDLNAPPESYARRFDVGFSAMTRESYFQDDGTWATIPQGSQYGINEMPYEPMILPLESAFEKSCDEPWASYRSVHDGNALQYGGSPDSSLNSETSESNGVRSYACESCGQVFTGGSGRGNLSRHLRHPHNGGKMNTHGDVFKQSVCLCGSVLSALGASSTTGSHSGHWTNHNFLPGSQTSLNVACTVGYGLCTAMLHSHGEGNEHRDACLIGGVILGTVAGISAGYDLRESLFKIVPWALLASLAVSRVAHLVLWKTHECKACCNEKS